MVHTAKNHSIKIQANAIGSYPFSVQSYLYMALFRTQNVCNVIHGIFIASHEVEASFLAVAFCLT